MTIQHHEPNQALALNINQRGPEDSPAPSGALRRLRKLITPLALAGIFLAIGRILYQNIGELRAQDFTIHYALLLPAYLALATAHLFCSLLWVRLVGHATPLDKPGRWSAHRAHFYSLLAKYLPGKIWQSVGKVHIGTHQGANPKTLTVCVYFEMVLQSVSLACLAFAAFFVIASQTQVVSTLWYCLTFAGVLLAAWVMLQDRVVLKMMRLAARLMKRNELAVGPTDLPGTRTVGVFLLCYGVFNAMLAMSFAFFMASATGFSAEHFIFAASAFLVANFLGRVSFFAPGGIGVREGALIVMLTAVVPVANATLVAVASRVWFIAVEVSLVGMFALIHRFIKK